MGVGGGLCWGEDCIYTPTLTSWATAPLTSSLLLCPSCFELLSALSPRVPAEAATDPQFTPARTGLAPHRAICHTGMFCVSPGPVTGLSGPHRTHLGREACSMGPPGPGIFPRKHCLKCLTPDLSPC